MPGPSPKDPAKRARSNVKSTAAQLVPNPDADVPTLPAEVLHPVTGEVTRKMVWHPLAEEEWSAIWKSGIPIAEVDAFGLLKYALLINDYYFADDPTTRKELSSEIRLIRREFGLTPISRATLHWTIINTEEAADKRAARVAQRLPPGADPRGALAE